MDKTTSIISTIVLCIGFSVLVSTCEPYHSNSGSMKILRTYGTVIKANDTIHYYSNNNDNINDLELRAILKLRSVTNVTLNK
jgi:hypothetical protein